MSSYQFSERINVHTILFYGLAVPLYRGTMAIENAWRFIQAALPHLLFALAIVAKALTLVAIVVGAAFLAFTFAVVMAKLLFGLAIVAAFGYATFPRSKKAVKA